MKSIDLNSDMGESFGAYKIGMDESVLKYITSANIACGWHAGDPNAMETTVRMAKDQGVGIGAHPGYPDLLGFGRRNMNCTPQAIVSINPDLYFVALAGKKGELMTRVGEEIGLKVIYEAFPDRAYTPQGTLAPRANPGAVITDPDEVAQRALLMARDSIIKATDGSTIELKAQTLCVHGDTPSGSVAKNQSKCHRSK